MTSSYTFSAPYKNMCKFWSFGFRRYISYPTYEWMLRIDDDVFIKSTVHFPLPPWVHFAASEWQDGTAGPFNKKHGSTENLRLRSYEIQRGASKDFGKLVMGMREMVEAYAQTHTLSGIDIARLSAMERNECVTKNCSIFSLNPRIFRPDYAWPKPYTNVMYVNLKWLANSNVVNGIMDEIEDTNCTQVARWGDMPIWGAMLAAANLSKYVWLNLDYHHKSHRRDVLPRTTPLPSDVEYASVRYPPMDLKDASKYDIVDPKKTMRQKVMNQFPTGNILKPRGRMESDPGSDQ